MKAPLALAALALLLLAGCAQDGGGGGGDGTGPASGGYALDCTLSNWDDPCTVRASPNEAPSKTEIDVAVDPADPLNLFVASKDLDPQASQCVWSVGQHSRDGGRTWNTTYVGGKASARRPGDLLYGWRCVTDPILAFGKDGALYYSLQVYRFNPLGHPYLPNPAANGSTAPPDMGMQVLAVSRDGGATFPELHLMHAGDSDLALFHDYMRMGSSPVTGTVFTIWNQLTGAQATEPGNASQSAGTSQPVLVAFEPDAGRVRPPVYFPTSQRHGLGQSGVVADNAGTVYAFLGGFNSPDEAYMAVSTDDGLTFTAPFKAFDFTPMGDLEGAQYRSGTTVEIAVDDSGGALDGCLYAAWADGGAADATPPATADPADILLRRSCDGAATWSEPALVSNGPHADGQWMPRVAVDGRGTVHVAYLTRAHDPAHRLVDAEWAHSGDGGRNWTTERLTARSFDGNLGIHQDGFPFLGDYLGIASAGDHTYVGFPDCHLGRCEVAVAHVEHREGEGTGTA